MVEPSAWLNAENSRRALLRRHADAGVGDGDLEACPVVALVEPGDRYLDVPLFGELDRVADQVGQDLAHPQRVAQEPLRHVVRHAEHQLQLLLAGPLPDQRIDVAQHVVDPERDGFDRQRAGLDLRKIEDVVDDAEQRHAGGVDLGEIIALLEVGRIQEREVGQPDDRVHRRPDLVAHIGEEHRLGLRRFLGHVPGVGKIGLRRLQFVQRRLGGVASRADLLAARGEFLEQPGVLDREHGLSGKGL